MSARIDRRRFISAAGGLVVGFSLFGASRAITQDSSLEAQAPRRRTARVPPLPSEEVDSWLTIDTDNQVTIYTGYIDAGTGIETVIRQIAADELDVPFESVSTVLGDTQSTPYAGISYGSHGVPAAGHQVRIAAAAAREALRKLGAKELRVPLDKVVTRKGSVTTDEAGSRTISYGRLFGGRRFDITLSSRKTYNGPALETTAPLKTPAQRRLIGSSLPRVDIASKVFATHEFVHDVRVPGMWHGRVLRPPSEQRVRLVRIAEESVNAIPNARIYRKGNFVAVIAPREEDAIRAVQALQVEWEVEGPALRVHDDRYEAVRGSPEKRLENEAPVGDAATAIAKAARQFERTYQYPYQLHGMSGPSCAVADVRPDGSATIWSGTQAPHEDRDSAAQILGFDPKRVRLIWRQAAGSYGRLGADDAVADAVILSQLSQRPVRVQWSRQEEHGWETVSPAMVMNIRAGVDHDGRLVGLQYEHWTAQHDLARRGHMLAWRHSGQPQDEAWAWGGAVMGKHYAIANLSIAKHITREIVRPASLRAPGYAQSYFALESFLDELAAELQTDPIHLRLRHLTDARARAVIETAARRSGWEHRAAGPQAAAARPRHAAGRGIAFIEEGQALVAAVAHVTVDRETGRVHVTKVCAVGDHGEIMNPDGLRNQYEGGILQGISRSLYEEARYENSRRVSLDWASYPVIRYDAVPELDIHLINNPAKSFLGGGEAPTAPLPAAIANAIFDATGARLRTLPFTPERMKAALPS